MVTQNKSLNSVVILICLLLLVNTKAIAQSAVEKWQIADNKREDATRKSNYEQAISYAKQCVRIAEKGVPDQLPNSRNKLAQLYKIVGNYSLAKSEFMQIMLAYEKRFGKLHHKTADASRHAGLMAFYLGQYNEAVNLLTKAWKMYKKEYGPNASTTQQCESDLAAANLRMGNYEHAKQLFLKLVDSAEKTLASNAPKLSERYSNLAVALQALGKYQEAEIYLKKAWAIDRINYGEEDPRTVVTFFNLGAGYLMQAKYKPAKDLLYRAVVADTKNYGLEHHITALRQITYAKLLTDIGELSQAKYYAQKAVLVYEKQLEKHHPSTINAYGGLGLIEEQLGNYAEALALQQAVLEANLHKAGGNHPNTAVAYSNIALLYKKLNKLDEAKLHAQKAVAIFEKRLGKGHSLTANGYSNLATICAQRNDLEEAEDWYAKALSIEENIFGENNPQTAITYSNYASTLVRLGKKQRGLSFLEKSIKIKVQEIKASNMYMSDQERNSYLKLLINDFAVLNSLILERSTNQPESAGQIYNHELLLKGLLLQSSTRLRKAVSVNKNPKLLSIYEKYRNTGILLSEEKLKPKGKRVSIDSLQEIVSQCEVKLKKKSKLLSQANRLVGWKNIQKKLKPDEAAIEYFHFKQYNKGWTGTTIYYAIVLRKEYSAPKIIRLFQEKELTPLLVPSKQNILYTRNLIHVGSAQGYGQQLNSMVWAPIDSLLHSTKTVYVTLSGILNRLSFAAIPLNDSTYLADKYRFRQLSSTRKVYNSSSTPVRLKKQPVIALFGHIAYDSLQVEGKTYLAPQQRGFTILPGTKVEIEAISELFNQYAHKPIINSYTQLNATKKHFLQLGAGLSQSPDVVHIATHGFYVSRDSARVFRKKSGKQPIYKTHKDPMFRSGLAFTNANYTWLGQNDTYNDTDGICTANELSNMNLSNTTLTVASACETGLGQELGHEGVYGLQRAFKLAGAKFVLVSLWQVPDETTADLMSIFYEHWLKGGATDIPDAFDQAQSEMRGLYKDSPELWAGFVLIN